MYFNDRCPYIWSKSNNVKMHKLLTKHADLFLSSEHIFFLVMLSPNLSSKTTLQSFELEMGMFIDLKFSDALYGGSETKWEN